VSDRIWSREDVARYFALDEFSKPSHRAARARGELTAAELIVRLEGPPTEKTIERYIQVHTVPGVTGEVRCQVYFIEAPGHDLIKIGRSVSAKGRFIALATMSPVPIRLLGVIRDSTHEHERHLHLAFAAARRHGEWFEGTRELRSFIEHNAEPA
jgi:hypothetical protein